MGGWHHCAKLASQFLSIDALSYYLLFSYTAHTLRTRCFLFIEICLHFCNISLLIVMQRKETCILWRHYKITYVTSSVVCFEIDLS
jgi:hypothetical protein